MLGDHATLRDAEDICFFDAEQGHRLPHLCRHIPGGAPRLQPVGPADGINPVVFGKATVHQREREGGVFDGFQPVAQAGQQDQGAAGAESDIICGDTVYGQGAVFGLIEHGLPPNSFFFSLSQPFGKYNGGNFRDSAIDTG